MNVSGASYRWHSGYYWLRRQHGCSLQFQTLADSAQMPTSAQLICAVLRRDNDRVRSLANKDRVDDRECTLHAILSAVDEEKLAGLLIHSAECGDFLQALAGVACSNGCSLEPEGNLLQALLKRTAKEAASYARFERKLADILKALSDVAGFLLIKGPVLARTVYHEPGHRAHGDVDLLVQPTALAEIVARLQSIGFETIGEPEFCNQIGIGPTNAVSDLLLVPGPDFLPGAPIGLARADGAVVDVKLDLFERGFKSERSAGVFSDSVCVKLAGEVCRVPSLPDQMLIAVDHFSKHGFSGWRWLYDLHLLSLALSDGEAWEQFCQFCELDDLQCAAWVALNRVQELMGTPVPAEVLQRLRPRGETALHRLGRFTLNPLFSWNVVGLPMLILNAALMEPRAKKFAMLRNALFPERQFLLHYYGRNAAPDTVPAWALLAHWLVLLLPGGITRRTLGRWLWREQGLFANNDRSGGECRQGVVFRC